MGITRLVADDIPGTKIDRFDDAKSPRRIYPVDQWEIPKAILDRASRYHFLRVPLLGQHNPQGLGGDWCGRTSSCMVYNYRKLALGEIGSDRNNYVTQWDNGDGKRMDLRHQDGSVAAAGYNLGAVLGRVGVGVDKDAKYKIFPGDEARDPAKMAGRAREALTIAADNKLVTQRLSGVLDSLILRNNPMVFYTGLSTSGKFRSHIIVIAGFCELRDRTGGHKLWLLIADPSPPKITKIFTPPSDKSGDDASQLDLLEEGKNDIIRIINADWATAKGALYLVRASHLFARNTVFPEDNTLWMDYTYDNDRNGKCEELGGWFTNCGEKTPSDPEAVISNLEAFVCFPFQREISTLESAVAQFFHAERPRELMQDRGGILPPTQQIAKASLADASGYYPLSSSGMVHSGIHLTSPHTRIKPAGVRVMAPGYIVAARLRKQLTPGSVGAERDFLAAYSGFVLVRHELLLRDESKGDKEEVYEPDPLPFYSLYMHFMPTQWPYDVPARVKDKPTYTDEQLYGTVGWLKRFFLCRYKAVVNLDPSRGPVGRVLWAASDIKKPNEDTTCTVLDDRVADKAAPHGMGTAQWPLKDTEAGVYYGYVRDPPMDLPKAYEALVAGKVVTFSKPLLPVSRGDTVGFCLPPEIAGGRAPAVLHWEVFCPQGDDSAFSSIVDIIADKHGKIDPQDISDLASDNILEGDEIKNKLAPALPNDADRAQAKRLGELIMRGQSLLPLYRVLLRSFYNGIASFVETDKPEPVLYPVTLKLKTPSIVPPKEKEGQRTALPSGNYTLAVQYFDASGGKLEPGQKITLTKAQYQSTEVTVDLKVPAAATRMEITPQGFYLDPPPQSPPADFDLAEKILPHLWRNAHFKHATEWSYDNVKTLIDALRDIAILPQVSTVEDDHYLESAWYKPPAAGDDAAPSSDGPRKPVIGEHAVPDADGNSKSLFESMLPADGKIENLHPVTLTWLLQLLQSNKACKLHDAFPLSPPSAAPKPKFWGFFHDGPRPMRVGHTLWAAVIADNYGSGDVTLNAELDGGSRKIEPFASGCYSEGVFAASTTSPMWGKWKLTIKDNSESPTKQGSIDAPLQVEIATPVMAESCELTKNAKTGLYSLKVDFSDHCPDRVVGFLTFSYTKVSLTENSDWPDAARWILDETGAFIEGLRDGIDKKVTPSFALTDYFNAPGENPPQGVAVDLCKAAQTVAKAFVAKYPKNQLTIDAVGSAGLWAILKPRTNVKQADLQKLVGTASGECGSFNTTVTLETSIQDSPRIKLETQNARVLEWTTSKWCLAVRSGVSGGKLVYDAAGRIQALAPGVSKAQLSASFSFANYWSAYERNEIKPDRDGNNGRPARKSRALFRLSPRLIDGVQALRRKVGALSLAPGSLEDEGQTVAVTIAGWNNKKAKVLYDAASAMSTVFTAVRKIDRLGRELTDDSAVWAVSVTVAHQEDSTAGSLELALDPRQLFGAVLNEALGEPAEGQAPDDSQGLVLRTAFWLPNGVPPIDAMDFTSATPKEVGDFEIPNDGDPDADVDDDNWLRASSVRTFKRLVRPRFVTNSLKWSMQGSDIRVTVELHGAKADWVNAKPALFMTCDDKSEAIGGTVASTTGNATLTANLPLLLWGRTTRYANPKVFKYDKAGKKQEPTSFKKITFGAKVTNPDALFDFERVKVDDYPDSAQIEIKPCFIKAGSPHTGALQAADKLELTIDAALGVLHIRAYGHCFPTDVALRVEIMQGADKAKQVGSTKLLLQDKVQYTKKAKKGGGIFDADGLFDATLPLAKIPEGVDLNFSLVPPKTVAGIELAPLKHEGWRKDPPVATSESSSPAGGQ